MPALSPAAHSLDRPLVPVLEGLARVHGLINNRHESTSASIEGTGEEEEPELLGTLRGTRGGSPPTSRTAHPESSSGGEEAEAEKRAKT